MLRIFPSALCAFLLAVNAQSNFYVDCEHGSDNANGSYSSPWATLSKAQSYIRSMQPLSADVTINLLPGDCFPTDTATGQVNYSLPFLQLGLEDSGLSSAVVTYRAITPGTVRLLSGLPVVSTSWTDLNDGSFQLDLSAVGAQAYGYGNLGSGGLGQCTNYQMELFYDDAPMLLGRYPNIASNGTWQYMHIASVTSALSFIVNDVRPLAWVNETNPWMHGFWSFDWADSYVRIATITPTSNGKGVEITVDASTPPVYGFLAGAKFYGVNLMSEVDTPTEYAFDASTNLLNFIPPSPISGSETFLSIAQNAIALGQLPATRQYSTLELMNTLDVPTQTSSSFDASYIMLDGLQLFFSRGVAISAQNVNNIMLSNLNVSNHGQSAVILTGANNSLVDSFIFATGCEASYISGGDETSLTSGFNVAARNTISNYARVCRTYQPGIGWGGVGNTFVSNNITNAPHNGFLGGGNNNIFASNYLADLCYEVSDSGAWYAGRSWVRRGNVLFNNTFERINNTEGYSLGAASVQAIYLDDQLSGTIILNNTFIDCVKGMFVGGGRDTILYGNTCIRNGYCVHIDNRGMNWQADSCAYNASYTGALVAGLFQVNYTLPPYSTQYPSIVPTLQDHPCIPVNISVSHNTWCTGPTTKGFIDVTTNQTLSWYDTVYGNIQTACPT